MDLGFREIIEAAERFTADPFSENSGGLWKDFDRLWESFRRISAGSGRIWQDFGRRSAGSGSPGELQEDFGRIWEDVAGFRQDFGRRSAGSGGPGLILVGKSQILEGIWWLGPVVASVADLVLPRRWPGGRREAHT